MGGTRKTTEASRATPKPADKPVRGDYTACVYVHGMGSQRRFEETCRLIDRIDAWVGSATDDEGRPIRMLRGVQGRIEPGNAPADPDVAFIRAYLSENDKWSSPVRFHELYWAPVMAGQRSAIGIAKWMLRQIWRPVVTLGSPWRERPRLRRAALTAMFDGSKPPGVEPDDYDALVDLYCKYENLESQRAVESGSFDGFLQSIADANEKEPNRVELLQNVARAWRRRYVRTELGNFFVLLTIGVALLLGLLGVAAAIGWLLTALTGVLSTNGATQLAEALPKAEPKTLASMAVAVVLGLGAGRFLTEYMADVQAWATFEETDEKFERRAKVIATGERVLRHVLEDEACKRVVLVAHSLGTSVAHDVLFALARYNKARNATGDPIAAPIPLDKIEHFVTMGSPVDKIEYFFESYVSPSHRFRRFREAMRGDIGDIPFTRGRKPHIHWINFWDKADLVSGALQSPASASGRRQRVDNVQIRTLQFPAPGAAHAAYFDDRRVIACLTDIIFNRADSFETLPLKEREDSKDRTPDYEEAYLALRPGFKVESGHARSWHLLALTLPWLVVLAIIGSFAETTVAWLLAAPMMVTAAVLVVGILNSIRQGPLFPIPPRERAREAEDV